MNKNNTYVALANTKHPPASPPPQQAHPIPRVQATCLSSFGAAHASNCSVTQSIAVYQPYFIAPKTPQTLPSNDLRLPPPDSAPPGNPSPTAETPGRVPVLEKGTASKSALATRTASSLLVKTRTQKRANAIAKKKPSQPPRLHNRVICSTSVPFERPLFMEPKATMPTTPRTTTIVP